MADPNTDSSMLTPLYEWHQHHAAKLVDFAGYKLPIQYPTGILAEHANTRTGAGLFDVSHMGRLRISGPQATAYLDHVLTSDVLALQPQRAQYTFICDEHGHALDDAYLYRLDTHYLLVVNAANHDAVLQWLSGKCESFDVELVDDTSNTAMVALQGPASTAILARLLARFAGSERPLPEKRNDLALEQFAGYSLFVSRTGYTGEDQCYELVCPAGNAVELCRAMDEFGATPTGLGARDSLRIEAMLPLYGHELGRGADGVERRVFSNALARFGVRRAERPYIGQSVLQRQREARNAMRGGDFSDCGSLPFVVRAFEVVNGRRPAREGYRICRNNSDVGWVTSGTTIPLICDANPAAGEMGAPAARMATRSVGLAMIEPTIAFEKHSTPLEAFDSRGKTIQLQLVERLMS